MSSISGAAGAKMPEHDPNGKGPTSYGVANMMGAAGATPPPFPFASDIVAAHKKALADPGITFKGY